MARLSVYDPFAEVFPEIFRGFLQQPARPQADVAEIRIEVQENAQQYQVQAELPGVKKEDINVQVDGNRVSITAETRREAPPREGERLLRSERFYGAMARQFTLGTELDETAVQARFDNGLLMLTLPKKQLPAARRVTIQ